MFIEKTYAVSVELLRDSPKGGFIAGGSLKVPAAFLEQVKKNTLKPADWFRTPGYYLMVNTNRPYMIKLGEEEAMKIKEKLGKLDEGEKKIQEEHKAEVDAERSDMAIKRENIRLGAGEEINSALFPLKR